MSASSYRRLTRKRRMLMGSSQAWAGTDHLLIVNSRRFVERYQRFAFSDIQAIVISEGPDRVVWQGLAVVASLFWITRGITADSSFGKGFFAITGLVVLFLAIRDIARGTRCRCVLQTAVSRERIESVSRLRTAERFLAAITPAIEAVQGQVAIDPTELDNAGKANDRPTAVQPPEIRRRRNYISEALFGVLLLDSLLVWVGLQSSVGMALGILPTIYFAEFLLGGVALFQARSRAGLTTVLIAAAFLCALIDPFALSGPAGWQGLMTALRNVGGNASGSNSIRANTPRFDTLMDTPMNTVLLSAGWRLTMAIIGLGACFIDRSGERNRQRSGERT